MINIIETKICNVLDSGFQLMVDELCQCVYLDKSEFENQPLSFLLMAIAKEKRKICLENILVSHVLDMKVGKLPLDSAVYAVCRELVNLKKSHIEFHSSKSVCTLIKQNYKFFAPTLKPNGRRKPKHLSSY